MLKFLIILIFSKSTLIYKISKINNFGTSVSTFKTLDTDKHLLKLTFYS